MNKAKVYAKGTGACRAGRFASIDAAIAAAREVLRELGFTEGLGYKRDIERSHRVYGTADEW